VEVAVEIRGQHDVGGVRVAVEEVDAAPDVEDAGGRGRGRRGRGSGLRSSPRRSDAATKRRRSASSAVQPSKRPVNDATELSLTPATSGSSTPKRSCASPSRTPSPETSTLGRSDGVAQDLDGQRAPPTMESARSALRPGMESRAGERQAGQLAGDGAQPLGVERVTVHAG
jgi:hypothetical protein